MQSVIEKRTNKLQGASSSVVEEELNFTVSKLAAIQKAKSALELMMATYDRQHDTKMANNVKQQIDDTQKEHQLWYQMILVNTYKKAKPQRKGYEYETK